MIVTDSRGTIATLVSRAREQLYHLPLEGVQREVQDAVVAHEGHVAPAGGILGHLEVFYLHPRAGRLKGAGVLQRVRRTAPGLVTRLVARLVGGLEVLLVARPMAWLVLAILLVILMVVLF